MTYIEYKEFAKKYPKNNLIGTGAYSSVFATSNNFVVKENLQREYEDSFFRELATYSRLNHPGIFKLEAWSYNFRLARGNMVMPLGMSLRVAYENGHISLDKIAVELMEIVGYLHSQGIAHLDIKPDNLVFYTLKSSTSGRVVLIDFGLIQIARLREGRLSTTGIGYSDSYRHPEYNEKDWNPVEFDYYAVGRTLAALYGRKRTIFDPQPKTDSELVNKIIRESTAQFRDYPWRKIDNPLKTSREICDIFEIEGIKWDELDTLLSRLSYNDNLEDDIPEKIMIMLTKIRTRKPIEPRTVFLAVELVQRYGEITYDAMVSGIILASFMHGVSLHFKDLKINDLPVNGDELMYKLIEILNRLGGQILSPMD